MKLPNAARAVVEIEKLRDYCLNTNHPRRRHKARVFSTALGITAEDSEELRDAILSALFQKTQHQPMAISMVNVMWLTLQWHGKINRLISARRGLSVLEKIIHGSQVVMFYRS